MSSFIHARLRLVALDIRTLMTVREVLKISRNPSVALDQGSITDDVASEMQKNLAELEQERASAQKAVTESKDKVSERWWSLLERVDLEISEEPVLALILAPLLDVGFRELLVTLSPKCGGFVTIGDAMAIYFSPEEQMAATSRFQLDAKLIKKGLIKVIPNSEFPDDFLQSRLVCDRRLIKWLINGTGPEDYHPWLAIHQPERLLTQLAASDFIKKGLVRSLRTAEERNRSATMVISGPDGSGRKALAAALSAEVGYVLVTVDISRLPNAVLAAKHLLLASRETLLTGPSYLYLYGLSEETEPGIRREVIDFIDSYEGIIFLSTSDEQRWFHLPNQAVYRFQLQIPGWEQRVKLWKSSFREFGLAIKPQLADDLGHRYKLTEGYIRSAAKMAGEQAWMKGQREPSLADIQSASTSLVPHGLGTMAEQITSFLRWSDLVLPEDTLEMVWDVIRQARNQRIVLDDWGFRSKLPYGRGISVLFWGGPGTGKTMVASLISQELDLDLYQIDLSKLVSKYIGETEKNIAKVFDDAQDTPAIILFDEADSLFSKRTEVKSSHDRYANLEVNYLLQRMENYDGISILTSNFEKSIDDAFRRRLTFQIEFPFPDVELRVALWKAMFPDTVHIDPSVNFVWLANEFELSGGYIKNAVLRAAFTAAEKRAAGENIIKMPELVESAVNIYKEMGKLYREKG